MNELQITCTKRKSVRLVKVYTNIIMGGNYLNLKILILTKLYVHIIPLSTLFYYLDTKKKYLINIYKYNTFTSRYRCPTRIFSLLIVLFGAFKHYFRDPLYA